MTSRPPTRSPSSSLALFLLLVPALLCLDRLQAAESPLGVVTAVSADGVQIRFDAGVDLELGSVADVYGPGSVERHPLTHEIIVQHQRLDGKVQILSLTSGLYQCRLFWSRPGTAIAPGMDVVPMALEAAPAAPPVLRTPIKPLVVTVGQAVDVELPIADPDGDPMHLAWTIPGTPGQGGVLVTDSTRLPSQLWIAPGVAGDTAIQVDARNDHDQSLIATVPVQVKAIGEDIGSRALVIQHNWGGDKVPLDRLYRDATGRWWGIADRTVISLPTGWMYEQPFHFAKKGAPTRPVAVRVQGEELDVLDAEDECVDIYGSDGVLHRRIGHCQRPSDLAIGGDGTVFIADQEAGGILVYEADGRMRCRLGQPGKGDDAFAGLTRITLAQDGSLYALDPDQHLIERFDRHLHRLPSWKIQVDERNPPVDIGWRPQGLALLQSNGSILVFDQQGTAGNALPPAVESHLTDRLGPAASMLIDADGRIYVCYPDQGLISRSGADGDVSGLWGNPLWKEGSFTADGRGRLFGLDADTSTIHLFDPMGFLTRIFGGTTRHGGPFREAIALAAAPDGAYLAVLDDDLRNVMLYNVAGGIDKPLIFGQPGRNGGQFRTPVAIAMDAAYRSYVLDSDLHNVQVFDDHGHFLYAFGHYDRGRSADELNDPRLLAVSPAGDAAYVYDADTYEVKKFALDQQDHRASHVSNAGGKGDGPGQIRRLIGLGCDRLGLLYWLDSSRGDLQLIDYRGSNAVAIFRKKTTELGMESPTSLTVGPDGLPYLVTSGHIVGLHW